MWIEQYNRVAAELDRTGPGTSRIAWRTAKRIVGRRGEEYAGTWIAPNVIVLDARGADDPATVCHEVAHAILQDPGHDHYIFGMCRGNGL